MWKRLGRRTGIARSVRLFRSFLTEQSDPDGFYRLIAVDAADLMEEHTPLLGNTVADFGGGPGYYSAEFRKRGARCILVDASMSELRLRDRHPESAVIALAERSPLADGSVDIAFSSNLLEHVADFAGVCDQIVRVVRPGGVVVLSYTIWLSPWGGHETSPWHYLGGRRAARRYRGRHGHPPKNVYGENMYAASVRQAFQWLRSRPDLEVLEVRPRYLPTWLGWIARIPVVREFVTWNLWLVVRRPANEV